MCASYYAYYKVQLIIKLQKMCDFHLKNCIWMCKNDSSNKSREKSRRKTRTWNAVNGKKQNQKIVFHLVKVKLNNAMPRKCLRYLLFSEGSSHKYVIAARSMLSVYTDFPLTKYWYTEKLRQRAPLNKS